jgi:hypothetical protein
VNPRTRSAPARQCSQQSSSRDTVWDRGRCQRASSKFRARSDPNCILSRTCEREKNIIDQASQDCP